MNLKDTLEVRAISYDVAMDIITTKHYLKRKCCCTCAFGLFDNSKPSDDLLPTGKLVGVIVFGKPASFTLCNGICGPDESKNVIEFNRLWVDDCMPKNTESFFVARALTLCPYEIIVSFADEEQGHYGFIYQATNFLYTGVSSKMKYYRLKGISENSGGTHYRRRERMTKQDIIKSHGEEMVEEYFSSPKFRYIYFNASKSRRKKLLKLLRYPIQPYPKPKANTQGGQS